MSDVKFFSIAGLATAAHTPETQKIWESWPKNKSDYGREAVLKYAEEMGYNCTEESTVEDAFDYLLNSFPKIAGIKSYILRYAIINYS